jgi:hypothetical protein
MNTPFAQTPTLPFASRLLGDTYIFKLGVQAPAISLLSSLSLCSTPCPTFRKLAPTRHVRLAPFFGSRVYSEVWYIDPISPSSSDCQCSNSLLLKKKEENKNPISSREHLRIEENRIISVLIRYQQPSSRDRITE